MDALSKELILLVHQFLCEEKYKKTVHMLEKESGVYFNMRYLEEVIKNGEWDEVDMYLSGFTRVDENRYSMKMFFDIRKQKYLEALDKNQYGNALEVLKKDLKVFAPLNEDLYKEITMLLALDNFRENALLSKYEDTMSARTILFEETKKLIQANPIFKDKLQLPSLKNSRLRTLINQSLNWQHQICPNPKSNPDIRTLFVDHFCMQQPNGPLAPSAVTDQFMCPMPNASCSMPLGAHDPLPSAGPITSLGGWMANTSTIPNPAICGGPIGSSAPNNTDSEHVLKRARSFGISEEINNKPINLLPDEHPGRNHFHGSYSSDDIPRIVVANLTQSSAVKSMDFHPVQEMMLLVGTSIGDIALWDVGRKSRLAFKNFKFWDLEACSMTLKASLVNEHSVSVNRVSWSPDGTRFGVAYSKNIVQLYLFNGTDDLQNHLEIDAHDGNVSDLAFSSINEELYIITGGDDKLVKVWSVATGSKQYTFEGHEAPVYSVSPHHKGDIQFVFSTSVDGKIRAWLYDDLGPRVNYDAPGQSCTRMIYSADGKRLFSCGTSKEGESHIVEWDENEGAVKRSYLGLGKRATGVVQLDTKNRVLVAGDEFAIKFWDIDNVNLLTTADADGGLPASPCIKFSKQGIFLAVSTSENGVKILGNVEGVRMVHSIVNLALDASRIISESVVKSAIATGVAENGTSMIPLLPHTGDTQAFMDMNPRVTADMEISRIWKLTEINEQAQLRSLRLPDSLLSVRVIRLSYTHSGGGIVALAYNAVHKLWRWQRDERNLAGKATTNIPPRLWQPSNGVLMTNDISETNLEYAVPCFAISKNDSYVASANGGRISLFNLLTFRTMTTFMSPRPAATSIAFHPEDNNIIVVGMEDASIQIYFVRVDKVQFTLRGHLKRVTGLAFSTSLNILVSSGADAKLCVWNMERWEDAGSTSVHIPSGRAPTYRAQTRVQFHKDQTHLLVVHETHIAIYEAPKLDLIKQWVPRESAGRVTDATYSCDSEMIYVCVEDGSICVLVGTLLRMRCRINPTAYLHSNPSLRLYPLVITAHPTKPDQFALGLTDGGVLVVEPLEAEGKWGTEPPQENGVGPGRLISAITPRHI